MLKIFFRYLFCTLFIVYDIHHSMVRTTLDTSQILFWRDCNTPVRIHYRFIPVKGGGIHVISIGTGIQFNYAGLNIRYVDLSHRSG